MTIEDVDFLIKNSEQNSVTIFIDSKDRDFGAYPTPSEYVVQFDEPIRNVFGFEILDASIPVTQFTVDKNNNTIAVSYVFTGIGVSILDFKEAFAILQVQEVFNDIFLGRFDSNIFFTRSMSVFNVIQSDIIEPTSNVVICLDTINLVGSGTAPYSITLDGIMYYSQSQFPSSLDWYMISSNVLYYSVYKYATDAATTVIVQEGFWDFYLCNIYKEVDIRNFSSESLKGWINVNPIANEFSRLIMLDDQSSLHVDWIDNVSPGEQSITQTYKWICESYTFIIDGFKSELGPELGFSEFSIPCDNYTLLPHSTNKRLFMSQLDATTQQQLIVTPGLINLETARYVIMRCPEIESHLLGNYSSMRHTPGIGLFKMIDSNTISNLRFDFVSIIRKPFHPIGKLSRLTLRFENNDGTLYNFKAVNHVILLSVKYYSPKSVVMSTSSILNRNYNPDVLQYIVNKNDAIRNRVSQKSQRNQMSLDNVLYEQQRYI